MGFDPVRYRALLREHRYRRRFLEHDIALTTRGIWLACVLQLLLLRNDWLLVGDLSSLGHVAFSRAAMVSLALGATVLLRRTSRLPALDVIALSAWALLVVSTITMTIDRVREGELIGPSIIAVAGLVLVHFGQSSPLWVKVIPAALLSVGVAVVLQGPLEDVSSVAFSSLAFSLVSLNLLCIQVSRGFDAHRRELFEAERHERRARQALTARVDDMAIHTSELSAQKARVEALARAKSDFMAAMSHELRTPMNAILGLSELLADRKLPGDASEEAAIIRDSARSLLRQLNDVLDHARLEAGRLELVPVPFDVRAMLSAVTSLLRAQARGKGVNLVLDVGREVPAWLVADEGRLRQLLLNLTANAIKFTAAGTVTIRVGHRLSADKHLLDVAVSDTGIGIEPSALERIFEPYRQADARVSLKFGGTGLGLPICKQIVTAMGGQLGVTSAPGVGSTFSFSVPVGAATRDSQAAEVSVHIPSLRLLVVDDNPINIKVAVAMLRKLGYEPATANDGHAALRALEQGRFDLAFVDIQMPGMSGLELAREIRRLYPASQAPRLVAMTASALDDDRKACFDAGLDDFIAKPVDLRTMCAALQRAAVAWTVGSAMAEGSRPRHLLPALEPLALDE